MFPWNIAKSAEAMFSRWAIKRVCKFLLKKKLGKFILGEIDLNQLDVQLSAGTIQLSDLALNVEYINQKLGAAAAAVTVKEGSIGSLLVKLPWKGDGCQIELDELEVVIVPCGRNVPVDGSKTSASSENDNYPPNHDSGKLEQDKVTSDMLSSMDVHEGVKTVAKMVKWLLSSFHVKVKKLIIAFDTYGEKEKNKRYCRTLVLRIAEVECGTRISEDAQLLNEPREDDFLGLSRLTNFLKFQGAVIEFLQMDGVEHQTSNPCPPGTSYGECFLGCSQATAMTPIVTGKNGGFSGHVKLSIPWKNGVLDIRRVGADAYIDPLELRFQPGTIICFIYLWEMFKKKSTRTEDEMLCNLTDSVYNNGRSVHNSSTPGPCSLGSDMVAENEYSVINNCSLLEEEDKRDALISESRLISDWVGRNQKDRTYAEPDFGASVDHFFECFDELRSSQSALGNSGMWNWTCSVFTAITAASNLASGSLQIPSEQKHVETNFKMTVAKISLLFSFFDEEPVHSCGGSHDQAKAGSYARYLGAEFHGLLLVLQVCPQEMNFEATVEHVEIDDHFSNGMIDLKSHGHSDCIKSQAGLIQKMQDGVQDALAPFCSSSEDAWMVNWSGYDAESELSLDSKNSIQNINRKGIYRDDVVKVSLLKTSGIGHCQVTVNSQTSDNVFTGPMSFTLKLPPFLLWVNFGIIDMISDLLKHIESSEMSSRRNDLESETFRSQRRSYSQRNEAKATCSRASSISTDESLSGSIFLSNARIILCFPYKNDADSGGYSFFDQFIALHFSSSTTNLENKKIEASKPASVVNSRKGNMLPNSRSLHLTLGNLGAYFITSDTVENVAGESCSKVELKFFAQKIMSVADGNTCFSVISMYWQDGAFTGPQIIKRAKILATAGNLTRKRFKGEDYEFTSVTTAKDMEDLDTLTRQEIILSSGFFLHAKLSPVNVNLEKNQYDNLIFILHQLNGSLSCMASDPVNQECPTQGSVLVECESIEFAVSMEVVESVKGSIQKELPGSWHSFKLSIQKFELLSVSNIGGIKDASFLWVVHREGNLLGSVTGVPHEEMLLISCSNSIMGRGDGEGSNVLSPRFSGSDIIHLWHPEDLHSYTSIAVRCGTVVAIGGRLDWWDAISSFFILPSPEIEQAGDQTLQEGNSETNRHGGSSFVLNLVDVALSYEPYFYDHLDLEDSVMGSCSASMNDAIDDQFFACLLAASSLRLSNTSVSNSSGGEYNIQVQDLALLLCPVSGPKAVGGTYDVEHLRLAGYVKIAREAHFEALLRTFSEQGLVWEVESSNSQIFLNTCYDTAAGLIRLCAQLQQLFAPDVEDTVVHLQNRWNNVKRASEETGNKTFDGDTAPLPAMLRDLDTKTKPHIGNLMDEICEDAFLLDAGDYQDDYRDQHLHMSFDDNLLGEPSDSSARHGESFSGCFPFGGFIPVAGLENDVMSIQPEKAPELIEEYFLSELSFRGQSSNVLDCKTASVEEIPIRNTGWYGDTSPSILENHVSDVNNQTNLWQCGDIASSSYTETDGYDKIKGRVLLKNMNVVWRMYAGSDWHNFKMPSAVTSGRDVTDCLEISLSGMQIQYDIFPDGEICVSRLSLSIQDFFMSDNSKNAPWKLILGCYQSKYHRRKSSSKAFKLDLESVLPDPSTPLEEYRLRVAFLPMRLHLHQSQLDFLINFFGGASVESSQSATQDLCEIGKEPRKSTKFGGHVIIEEALLPYFQKFDIWPVLIRVDYIPSRVNLAALSSGKYVELVNLVPWKGVELQLKHVHAVGVYGWSCVCETVIGEWLEDISQTQIHKLLKGVPPIRSFFAVGSGAAKLWKTYRKDKRLLKGMQRGAVAFLRSISLEAIELGVHLAAGAHDILLQAEYILPSIPPSESWNPQSRGNINVRSNQPKDARQGIKQAYESISDGLGKSASALVCTPLKRYQRDGGIGSALATAVRAAPVAAIAPASAATRAIRCALLGVRNRSSLRLPSGGNLLTFCFLDPEHKKESSEKYLGAAQCREFMQ